MANIPKQEKNMRNGLGKNPGGGRPTDDRAPRGRGTVTRGERSPATAQSEDSEREKRLRGEVGRDPNDRR